MREVPTGEEALFRAMRVEKELKGLRNFWRRRRFDFHTEYVRQYALIVAEKASQSD